MSDRLSSRLAATWFAAVIVLILSACAGAAGSPAAGQAPAAPSASAPAAVDPGRHRCRHAPGRGRSQ